MPLSRRDILVRGGLLGGLAAASSPRLALARGIRADRTPPEPEGMDSWWTDLEMNEPHASRALLKFSTRPNESVPYFADRMGPLRADPDWLQVRLKNLGSDKPEVWKPAFEELEYHDPRLTLGLETLMKDVTEAPARQRLVEVLSGRPAGSLAGKKVDLRRFGEGKEIAFNFVDPQAGSWWAEPSIARLNATNWGNPKKKWTRAVRALALLEHIGTRGAVAILAEMATGDPDAQPSKVAKEALERVSGKAP